MEYTQVVVVQFAIAKFRRVCKFRHPPDHSKGFRCFAPGLAGFNFWFRRSHRKYRHKTFKTNCAKRKGARRTPGIFRNSRTCNGCGSCWYGSARWSFAGSRYFFVFADYMRPAIRLAAISRAKCVFIFSHDSVGVGEDGPTHQPVEQLASLRAIPGLQVIRPADPNETVAAWCAAVDHDGPTALILSRQNVQSVTDGSAVQNGAGVVRDCQGTPTIILVGTGSEVGLCVDAANELNKNGEKCRVVSMPSWDRFERLTQADKEKIFTPRTPVMSIEAGVTMGWDRYADLTLGIDRFGASAKGAVALEKLGINLDSAVLAAATLIKSFNS